MGKRTGHTAVSGLLWDGDIIHLVYQQEAADVLQKSFALDDSAKGEIMVIQEDYSVGSIKNLNESAGWQQRKQCWQEVSADTYEADKMAADKLTVHHLIKKLNEQNNLHLWIWMGQNEQDVCGYYWLITQLRSFTGRVQVLYLNNLPFINEKGGIFYPLRLAEIMPAEFLKARKLAREVSAAEFELDEEEWKRLSRENAFVRTLEGGKKVVSQPDNYFDQLIIDTIGKDKLKLHRLFSGIVLKQKKAKPDVFWLWRLRHLVMCDRLLLIGEWDNQKELVFKINNGELFQEATQNITGDLSK